MMFGRGSGGASSVDADALVVCLTFALFRCRFLGGSGVGDGEEGREEGGGTGICMD